MRRSRKKNHPLVFFLVVLFVDTRCAFGLTTSILTSTGPTQHLLVYFDGSLRKPADPGFATESLGWMAACAASVSSDNDETILLGGRDLTDHASSAMSSGAVEYEGLLLALQGLSSVLRDRCFDSSSVKSITVRGDCKTVIQQLQGRAISRKMDGYYQQAERLIQDDPVLRELDLAYEHIPRLENMLCDRLCAAILHDRQAAALDTISKHVEYQRRGTLDPRTQETDSRKVRKKGVDGKKYFTLEVEKAWKLIPTTKRPQLYGRLVAPSAASNSTQENLEYSSLLLEIAQRLRFEVETVWRKANLTDHCSPDCLATLEARALAYEWKAIQQTTSKRKSKELARFEQRNRYMWKKHATLVRSILEEMSSPQANATVIMSTQANNNPDWPAPVTSWQNESRKSISWEQDKILWHACSTLRIAR